MDPTRIGLFDLAEKRLTWTAQRQSVLAANIANANTPGYPARVTSNHSPASWPVAAQSSRCKTQPAHMSGTLSRPAWLP